ncbi:MAG TPA: dipeptidase [Candidatus Luteimonas excrementigallinarum]|nr:dipeptidase [Candidatus Luteimonas excrementigallinarum]
MLRRSLLAAAVMFAASTVTAQDAPEAARQLAQDAIIVDTHIDAPGLLLSRWADLGVDAPDREFDYPRARAGGLDVGFMAIYTSHGRDEAGTARQHAHNQIDAVEALAGRHPDKFAILTSPGDVETLREGGRVLLSMGMENAGPLGDDVSQVEAFFNRGVRYIGLTHSGNNRIGDSSYTLERKWNGLSPFGREVIAEMNRLGMIVDVSHVSDETARDVIEVSTAPVIASHSGFRHFTPGFERNLDDELAKEIAATGGVIQIPFGTMFLDGQAAADIQAYFVAADEFERRNAELRAAGEPTEDRSAFERNWEETHPVPDITIDPVLDQIDHGVKLVGIDHIGLGSDFDGVGGDLPENLRTVADFPHLVAGLQQRGYSDDDIRKILGGNMLRAWTAIEAAAGR